jgi:uncharacterized repeat protein (TIGR03803 family)
MMRIGKRSFVLKTGYPAALAAIVLAAASMCVVAQARAPAVQEKVLHGFAGGSDGAEPVGGLIWDAKAKNLYGTTAGGGPDGLGAVYKVNAAGKETVLYAFKGGTDGAEPTAALIWDAAGKNLYGTTLGGGAAGDGTVFEIGKTGSETVLYAFCAQAACADGAGPNGNLIWDATGDLLGTTEGGGNSQCSCGTVFMLSPSGNAWKETVIYSFQGGADGAEPTAGMIPDTAGNLYGTTAGGGTAGLGTVFELANNGEESVLHTFLGGEDGAEPEANLVWDRKQQFLYGTTAGGGEPGLGTVFRLASNGSESVLYAFQNGGDAEEPTADLIWGNEQRYLYGTALGGGASGLGAVFKISKSGKETVLYSFMNGGDSEQPKAGLIPGRRGKLYGTAIGGGAEGLGTVFELKP